MADNSRPQSAPCLDPGGTVTPARVLSMNAADRYDPDAITVVGSRRGSCKFNKPPEANAKPMDKDVDNAAERYDGGTSVAAAESQDIPREYAEPPTGAESPGYARMTIMRTHILPSEKTYLFVSILMLATCQSLDNFLRVLYQYEVATNYQVSGMLGALNTVPTLSAATMTPLISKSADVFGRPETLVASIASYVLGTALQAKSTNIGLFTVGTVFWAIGFLGVISMFEIIIADLTSMRLRVIVFYLPAIPYLATTWFSAALRNTLVKACPSVEWRFAWSAILYVVCSIPLVIGIFIIERNAKKRLFPSEFENTMRTPVRGRVSRLLLRLRQMDILGWICFVGIVTCLLAPWASMPLVVPHGQGVWLSPATISVTSTGLLFIPIFYYVEKYSKYPMFPSELLWEKRILTALMMGFLYHLAYYVQSTYLLIGLGIRYNNDEDSSARIVGLYTFTSTLVGLFIGVIISITRDLRWYLRFGAIIYLASFVIQYTRPSGADNVSQLAVTCSQVLLGIAGGLFPFPAMAFVQGARDHTQLSTLLGAYMTACRVGSGVGQSLAGAIWTNALLPRLHKSLDQLLLDDDIDMLYAMPTSHEQLYPWSSPPRKPMVEAFVESHRYLCLIGIIASTLLIILAFLVRDASLEGLQEHEDIELQPRPAEDVQLKEASETTTPRPLRPSRHPIIM
ncbi:MFS general substrate transporter [Karstenula rhodostoma CBS 690.94]|uniref:MFS general substrate transporter n=1 Tax=Karstenula rhodostoma CBS 690.94 TaxID=1392251 RepID=A0A9P4PHA1_9PLEO|nr:MFS general substrate transporter [Karstenula rhodostoma CBS 690.94]